MIGRQLGAECVIILCACEGTLTSPPHPSSEEFAAQDLGVLRRLFDRFVVFLGALPKRLAHSAPKAS